MFALIVKAMENAFACGLCQGWDYEYDPIPNVLMVQAKEPKGASAYTYVDTVIRENNLKAVQFKGALYIRL